MTTSPAQKFIDSLPHPLPAGEIDEIKKAFDLAESGHGAHSRPSGEHYLDHAVAVAALVRNLGMDGYCIAAALLHEITAPHTSVNLADVASVMSTPVVKLVRGLQTLESFTSEANYRQHQNQEEQKLEEIRRTLLLMVRGEVHVILIRMADYVVDLRKAKLLTRERQVDLAEEAMNIYAPLANRLGVWRLKWQLEDLAFRYLEPETYQELARRLDARRTDRDRKIKRAVQRLQKELDNAGIRAQVFGRPKHIFSIYRKMTRKKVGFEDIHDKYAIRVVIDTGWQQDENVMESGAGGDGSKGRQRKKARKKSEQEARGLCYQVFGIVHGLWQHIPQEFDDYIANPKPNGYQSLHTAVIDDSGQTLEVQIRTDKMHDEAERGIAAHWLYKEGNGRPSPTVNKYIQSLRQLLAESQSEALSEFGDGELLRTEMLSERLFVFTPNGDMVDLPIGSTPIDFAYAIHTHVGHRCRGAKVNDVMVSLDHVLQSGDRIEIITANRGGPSRDWMNANLGYTGNPRTRSKIRQWFRQQEREKNVAQGRDLVERELQRLGLADTFTIEDIAKAMGYEDVEQCLAAAGFGDIQMSQIGGAIAKLKQKLKPDDEILDLLNPAPKPARRLKIQGLDMDGLQTKMAGCCTPIPPEPIIGYITRGHGITIHRSDCRTVLSISEQERILELEWGLEQERYPIPIVVRAYRRRGLTDDINKVLKGRNISVPKTKTTTSQSVTTIYMVVEVVDLDELDWLLLKLETLTNVLEVKRQRWTD